MKMYQIVIITTTIIIIIIIIIIIKSLFLEGQNIKTEFQEKRPENTVFFTMLPPLSLSLSLSHTHTHPHTHHPNTYPHTHTQTDAVINKWMMKENNMKRSL